jgi:inosine-uridine nucleoside N-ribohydrolase
VGAYIRNVTGPGQANFPLWDPIAAAVWLDPKLVTEQEDLFVDYDTQFGAGYGDTLSWRNHYQPGVGERSATVVRAIDPKRLNALIVRLMGNSKAK